MSIAFAKLSAAAQQDLSLDYFQNSMDSTALRRHLLVVRPTSLTEAVKAGNKFLQVQAQPSYPGVVYQVKDEPEAPPTKAAPLQATPVAALTEMVNHLTRQVKQMVQIRAQSTTTPAQQTKPPICRSCQQEGRAASLPCSRHHPDGKRVVPAVDGRPTGNTIRATKTTRPIQDGWVNPARTRASWASSWSQTEVTNPLATEAGVAKEGEESHLEETRKGPHATSLSAAKAVLTINEVTEKGEERTAKKLPSCPPNRRASSVCTQAMDATTCMRRRA